MQNGIKFTHPHSEVFLRAYVKDDRVLIEVEDHCGGLPPGKAKAILVYSLSTTPIAAA